MGNEGYVELLDRAFSKLPSLSEEKSDFRIPEADSLIEGNKTLVKNFNQIKATARRDGNDIAKYLSKELAAPVSTDDQKLIISTRVQPAALNSKIRKYFEVFVICKECHKPDTRIESTEHGYETLICEACGARYTIKR